MSYSVTPSDRFSSYNRPLPTRTISTNQETRPSSYGASCSSSGGRSTSLHRVSGLSSGLQRLSLDQAKGSTGLDNVGNTCFMNCILQCLIHTAPLRKFCKSDLTYINPSSAMKGKLVKSFARLAEKVWNNETSEVYSALREFRTNIIRHAPLFSGSSQHDAQEFLVFLLEGMHEDINQVSKKPYYQDDIPNDWSPQEKANESWRRYLSRESSFIINNFVGQLKSTLTCKTCGYQSDTYDPYFDLSLPIPRKSATSMAIFNCTLDDCLQEFTSVETLDGTDKPRCDRCKSPQPCTKRFRIEKFPKILVIHLKRFSMRNRFSKLDTKVSFPLNSLCLVDYASEEQKSLGGISSRCTYNLYAVANHTGTAFSGHYTAYCKMEGSGGGGATNWRCFNDRSTSELMENRVSSSSAYVLFYELANSSSRERLD